MSTLCIWPEAWAQGLWPGQSPLVAEVQISRASVPPCSEKAPESPEAEKGNFSTPPQLGLQPSSVSAPPLLQSSQYEIAQSPVAHGRTEGLLSFLPLPKSSEALRSWAVPPLSRYSLLLKQILVLTLHQSIWAHLKSRKAGSLLLRRETSVSLTRLRSMTLFI